MAWVRIHDGATTHPKLLALSDRSFRVWINGLSYCQMHLTDGFIPTAAALLLGATEKVARELCAGGLWHVSEAKNGWNVHEYLDWNDSREVIRAKRASAAERKSKWKGTRSERVPERVPEHATERVPHTDLGTTPTPLHAINNPPTPLRGAVDRVGLTDAETGQKAAAFLERYPEVYARERNGATYRVKEARDFPVACQLVTTYPDPDHLHTMLRLFLRKDFGNRNKPGSPGQFAYMAPECDSLIREDQRKRA